MSAPRTPQQRLKAVRGEVDHDGGGTRCGQAVKARQTRWPSSQNPRDPAHDKTAGAKPGRQPKRRADLQEQLCDRAVIGSLLNRDICSAEMTNPNRYCTVILSRK